MSVFDSSTHEVIDFFLISKASLGLLSVLVRVCSQVPDLGYIEVRMVCSG